MSTISSNAAALGIVDQHFAVFDIAAERAANADHPTALFPTPDGNISYEDLRTIAYDTTGTYTAEQQEAARWLLDHPELLRMTDTASQDSPMSDGIISRNDVDATLASPLLERSGGTQGVFARPYDQSLQTLQSDFDVFDGAGDGGKTDGKVSVNDLIAVGYGEEGGYTPEQRATARYLLDHMELVARLDGNGDGMIEAGGIAGVLADPNRPANANASEPQHIDVNGDGRIEPGVDILVAGASLDLDGDGVLSDVEIQAGAEANAPVLVLPPGDGYLLIDPDRYIAGSVARDGDGNIVTDPKTWLAEHPGESLVIDPGTYFITDASQYTGNGLVMTTGTPPQVVADPAAYFAQPGHENAVLMIIPNGQVISDPSQIPANAGGTYTTAAEGWVVDDPAAYLAEHPGVQLIYDPGLGNRVPDASKTYYQYDPATNSITYWFFYPNNDGPTGGTGIGDAQNHEGDWERVTIQLDADDKPATVYCSAHSGSSGVPYEQTLKHDGKPMVFVAEGSHANYFVPGDDYHTEFPTVRDETVDKPSDGLLYDTAAETALVRIDPEAEPGEPNAPPWWYDADVRWGEQSGIPGMSGPSGPNPDKGTLAPPPPPVERSGYPK